MKQENKRLLNATLTTLVGCLIVYALSMVIFDPREPSQGETPPVVLAPIVPIIPKEPEPVVIPIIIDNTGTLATSGVLINTGITNCTLDYLPVCGDDQRTYSNICTAQAANIAVAYDGECKKIIPTIETKPEKNLVASTGGIVKVPVIEDVTICTEDIAPVCGTDNKTYSNACKAGSVSIAHIGECDGTERKVYDAESYHLYANSALGYGFAMPKYSYYSGAGARDGAVHTMAIATTASGIIDFNSATIQLWYYKVAPATPPSEQSRKTENGILYIRNNDTTGNAKIGKIIQTVIDSVE